MKKTMQKKAFLILGWDGHPAEGWRPWLKRELEKRGIDVVVPAMPHTHKPVFKEWIAHIKKVAAQADEHSYFVGHSLGCITILRFIESLHPGKKIGGAVLVAGFTSNLGFKQLESFYAKPIEWAKIRKNCKKFVAIHSDNDPFVSLHYADFFRKELHAQIVVKHHMKHFSGGDGVMRLPAALDAVREISSAQKGRRNSK